MKVWRIEHKESGLGPWIQSTHHNRGVCVFLSAIHNEGYRERIHPSNRKGPRVDGGNLENYAKGLGLHAYHFGLYSLAGAKYWFRSAKGRKAMAQVGFVLRQYEVATQHVLKGNTQVAFRKEKATLLQERVLS